VATAEHLLEELIKLDDRVSREDYYDEDDDDWDLESLEADLRLSQVKAMRKVLESTQDKQHELYEPVLQSYLERAGEPWCSDFYEMQPLRADSREPKANTAARLATLKDSGILKDVAYRCSEICGSGMFALAACDIGCGFVAGTGFAESEEAAKELAVMQALEQLEMATDPLKELRQCAEVLPTEGEFAEPRTAALQTVEVIEVLKSRLTDVRLCTFRPCGKAWMAAISCKCFDNDVLGPSAEYDKSVALALAAQHFLKNLRWHMRVAGNEPHKPEHWEETWEQRKAAQRRSWDGRSSVINFEDIRLGALKVEKSLKILVSNQASRDARSKILKASAPVGKKTVSETATPATPPEPVCLDFKTTSAAEDPRLPRFRGKLPVEAIRGPLGEILQHDQVVVISGGTGSGKTTQVPQFLLDDSTLDGRRPRIVVTQPRRIAAISVSERVAAERGEPVGKNVGYAVHANAVPPSSTDGCIEFVTVGTLLQRAIGDTLLERYEVIIVDEVHDRDLATDFLLALLREVVPQRPDLRIVLMSATLDIQTFTDYFDNCRTLEIDSKPLFPVEEIHMEDKFFKEFTQARSLLQAEGNLSVGAGGQLRWNGNWSRVQQDKMLDLMQLTVSALVAEMDPLKEDKGAFLCFLPGWLEIQRVMALLQNSSNANKMWLVPLHSMLPKEDQKRVFAKPPRGKIKIILATNIAESSVTIDDVEIVVDAGLQKEFSYDSGRRMSALDTVWVSKSGATQRGGRAGRVRPGRVYRLYSRRQHGVIPAQPSPEMQRCDLSQCCLQSVALGRNPPKFLQRAMDPPGKAAVQIAMDELVAIGAIEMSDDDETMLLPVGTILTRLPLDPMAGRAAMLGCMLGAPKATAALLIAVGSQPPFVGDRRESTSQKRSFCDWSDALATAHAMLAWEDRTRFGSFQAARAWAREKHLSPSILGMLLREMKYLLRDLSKAGLTEGGGQDDKDALAAFAPGSETLPLVTAVLCAAHPTCVAKQPSPTAVELTLASGEKAIISQFSVNGEANESSSEDGTGSSIWWLFNELQAASQGHNFAHHTTRLQAWQIALFGGLYYKAVPDTSTDVCMELDYWLKIRSVSEDTRNTLLMLRQDLTDAYSCAALYARSGGRLKASKALRDTSFQLETRLQKAILLLAGVEVDISKEVDASEKVEAGEEQGNDEVEDKQEVQVEGGLVEPQKPSGGPTGRLLKDMLVSELRSLAKQYGLEPSGRKALLLERLSDVYQH